MTNKATLILRRGRIESSIIISDEKIDYKESFAKNLGKKIIRQIDKLKELNIN